MLVISLATAGTVITLHIHKQGDYRKPLPRILKIIFFDLVARALFLKIRTRNNDSKIEEMKALLQNKQNEIKRCYSRSTLQLGLISNRENEKILNERDFNTVWPPKDSLKQSHLNYIKRLNEGDKSKIVYENDLNDAKKNFNKTLRALNKNLSESELKNDLEDRYEEIRSEWAQLANIVDVLFFLIFVTFTIGISFVFIYFYVTY